MAGRGTLVGAESEMEQRELKLAVHMGAGIADSGLICYTTTLAP